MSFIKLDQVSFCYQNTGFKIKGVSLEFCCGSVIVLAGKNGSGKTTLSKLMMGILKPQNGQVWVNGRDIQNQPLEDTAKNIGYLFQNPQRQLFCSSVLEEILFSLRQFGTDKKASSETAMELLKRFSLEDKAKEYPLRLSYGQKRRLALLTVFAMKPKYYILDEPSSGIDGENKEILMDMLKSFKAEGAGICMITHEKTLIENLADRIITIDEGSITGDKNA